MKQTSKVQEAQRVPNKMNPRRSTPRHIIIKVAKIKDEERILRAGGENTYIQGKPHKVVS